MSELKGTGTIEEKTDKVTQKGDLFYKLKIDNRTYNCFDRTEAFTKLKAGDFPVGTVVSYNYTETVSGENTYKNLTDLVKVEGAKAEAFVPKKPYENKTGSEIIRQNVLRTAVQFFELNKHVIAMNLKKGDSLSAGISEDMVIKLAEVFEKWVKR